MGTRRTGLVLVLLMLSLAGWAQVNRYMVYFKDKTGTPYTIGTPNQFLTARSIERRQEQGIAINEDDLPVNPAYVSQLVSSGANVLYTSRWMNGALVQCDVSQLGSLEGLPVVERVELAAPNEKPSATGRHRGGRQTNNRVESVVNQFQLGMLGLDYMHSGGYTGNGVFIAVLDDGFQGVNNITPFQPLFAGDHVDMENSFDFVHKQADVFLFDDHGTEVLSVMAAYEDGVYTGGAYEADYVLFVTEDIATEYRIEEYNWLIAAERADSLGVDIIHTSLGYYSFDDASMNYAQSDMDGSTTIITQAAAHAVARGMVVVASAGNEGARPWQIITAPADGRDLLAVGGVTSEGVKSNGSSTGPSADGRIKPDVAALGVSTSTVKSSGNTGFSSGTSLAAPLVTSLVAGLWQRYPELTNLQVMQLVRESASQASTPDNLIGYGIPNFRAAVNLKEYRQQDAPFAVYPNPIAGNVSIRPNSPETISKCRLQMISLSGQLMLDYDVSFDWLHREYTATTQDLPSGLYILRIFHDENLFTFKVVKL